MRSRRCSGALLAETSRFHSQRNHHSIILSHIHFLTKIFSYTVDSQSDQLPASLVNLRLYTCSSRETGCARIILPQLPKFSQGSISEGRSMLMPLLPLSTAASLCGATFGYSIKLRTRHHRMQGHETNRTCGCGGGAVHKAHKRCVLSLYLHHLPS